MRVCRCKDGVATDVYVTHTHTHTHTVSQCPGMGWGGGGGGGAVSETQRRVLLIRNKYLPLTNFQTQRLLVSEQREKRD